MTETAAAPTVYDIETSANTEALDEALAKAQGEITNAAKDKVNPHFGSKYADLAAVLEACREPLAKNGVAVTQWPVTSSDGRLHLVTRMACKGQWIKARWAIPVQKNDPQGYVSATTYARRAALSAAVGVAPDEDDDGNAASGKAPGKPAPAPAAPKGTGRPAPQPTGPAPAPAASGPTPAPSPSGVTNLHAAAAELKSVEEVAKPGKDTFWRVTFNVGDSPLVLSTFDTHLADAASALLDGGDGEPVIVSVDYAVKVANDKTFRNLVGFKLPEASKAA